MYVIKENLTSILGVLGFAISLINLIYNLYHRRKKLNIEILAYHIDFQNRHNVYITFINKSTLPISITQLSLIINNKKFLVKKFQESFYSGLKNVDDNTFDKLIKYSSFPINVDMLSSNQCYVRLDFQLELETLPKILTFEVGTNRGLIKKVQLELPEPVDLLKF